MSDQWEVKSVSKSGNDVHITLSPVSTDLGIVGTVFSLVIVGAVAWAFFSAFVLEPHGERDRVWTAAHNQTLECGDQHNAISAYYSNSEGQWTFMHNHDTPTDRVHNGRFQFYPIAVLTKNDIGIVAVAQNGVGFGYDSKFGMVVSPQLGQWNNCRVSLRD